MAEYEFTEEQNVVINGVNMRLIVQAILIAIVGALQLTTSIILFGDKSATFSILLIVQSIFIIMAGLVFIRPTSHLRMVTTTEGTDITEMMKGMKKLSFAVGSVVVLILLAVCCDVLLNVLT
jgi:hypothetical protein